MFHNELANDVNAPWKWNYWNAVFYAATIFTTIGYGNLTCKTTYGRLITIVYGTIGIPLMLLALKIIGEGILIYFQKAWNNFKRKMRHFKRCWVRSWKMRRTNTIESVSTMDILTGERIEEEPEPDVIFSTIPLTLVLLFVILFMILCSIIVSFWEQWDYFTSFYFFFVSLSTIGFGDIIPQHPKYACLLFGLYFIGLALFSMVYAILQERVENKYMWALTLIDQMYSEPQQTCEVEAPPTVEAKIFLDQSKDEDFEKPKRLLSYQFEPQTSVRFRNRFASESQESVSVDRPSSEYRFSVLLTPGETPKPLPPALGALMAFRSSLKNKQLVRSDSSLSKLTQSSKREFGNTPSVSENLTPNEMSLSAPPPWNILDASLASPALTTLGSAQGAASTPSLVGRLAPLSVIAEVSDEDSLLTKHSSKRKGIHQLVRLEAVKSEVGTSSDLKSPSQDSLPDDKFMEELNITEESPCSLPSVDPERLQVPEGSSQPLPNKLRRLPAQDIPSPSLNPDSPSQIPLLSIQRPSEITEEE